MDFAKVQGVAEEPSGSYPPRIAGQYATAAGGVMPWSGPQNHAHCKMYVGTGSSITSERLSDLPGGWDALAHRLAYNLLQLSPLSVKT